ncbi:hypothetical protein HYPSUDRAFT_207248 [Hypholoma sublateritium FD-334 SS-4]|uniref:Uncharacterized protein n=1 Tax=Hypholoma sublateritium (strain FD-334 SS-4) TaxID=945553 RepID=A0A0D2LZ97_HYPSF|nr:hypothetical protein HYPSUDRAFT_207248 [Hypholoma sublateritium FD-334 SS-4]
MATHNLAFSDLVSTTKETDSIWQPSHLTTTTSLQPMKSAGSDDYCTPDFAEALASPVKYAFFQVLGYKVIQAIRPIEISSRIHQSLRSSASIGALGGGVLAMVYTVLLFSSSKRHEAEDNYPTLRSIASSLFQALGKEIIFSACAAVIGATITGRDNSNNLPYLIVAGLLGPIVALSLMLGALGVVIVVAWGSVKLKGRFEKY